jgi:type III secretory pathway component EscV
MKRQHIPLYATAVGLLVIGALAAGVPASTLLLLAVVLACPAMMLFMHGGHGGHGGQAAPDEHAGHRGHDHGAEGDGAAKPGDGWSVPRR